MKISKSKQELARIISENGGWRDGEFAAQDSDGGVGGYGIKPEWSSRSKYWWRAVLGEWFLANKIKNHHQTVLSRAEYLHLYPAQDADGWIEWGGGECPVDKDAGIDIRMTGGKTYYDTDAHWGWNADSFKITHYRLHKPEQSKPEFCDSVMGSIPEPTAKPTIEQLASDYRNANDYAARKQQEADDAKVASDAALGELERAGEALGILIGIAKPYREPKLVITDWRDLQVGDVISVSGKWWEPDSEHTVDENDGSSDAPIRVGGYWALIGECSFKFIRRP